MNWSTAAGGNGPSRDLYATSVNRLALASACCP
jgi:hypothetical protein